MRRHFMILLTVWGLLLGLLAIWPSASSKSTPKSSSSLQRSSVLSTPEVLPTPRWPKAASRSRHLSPSPRPSTTSRSALAGRRASAPVRTARTLSGGERLESTAYCLTGRMANGQNTYRGAVAANRWPLGTRLLVSSSPAGVGTRVTVTDRIGHGSSLDFALPGDCAGARSWGRRTVTVQVIES